MCLRLQNYNFFPFPKHKISLYPPQFGSHRIELTEFTGKNHKSGIPNI